MTEGGSLVIAIRTVHLLLVVSNEGNVDHVLLAADTDEAIRMERPTRHLDHLAKDVFMTLWTLFTLLLVTLFTKDLAVAIGVVLARHGLATSVTLFCMLLQ